jgi:hypothetical protein
MFGILDMGFLLIWPLVIAVPSSSALMRRLSRG